MQAGAQALTVLGSAGLPVERSPHNPDCAYTGTGSQRVIQLVSAKKPLESLFRSGEMLPLRNARGSSWNG